MSRVCQVTGKKPASGNNVSHANNKTRRRFLPNLHNHRFWLESEKRYVKLRVSTKGLRIIDKRGIEKVVADLRAAYEKWWDEVQPYLVNEDTTGFNHFTFRQRYEEQFGKAETRSRWPWAAAV